MLLFYMVLIAAKSKSINMFLEANTDYSLMLKNGTLRLTKKDFNYKFKIKKDKCKWPIVKHIHTPKDLYNYLIHVLDGPKWRMVGTNDHFQIRNGMYCVTGLTDIIKGCDIDYPMVLSPCSDTNENQWFTAIKNDTIVACEQKKIVGFPYEMQISDKKTCKNKGRIDDEHSITKRIQKKIDNLNDECNDCMLYLDKKCGEKENESESTSSDIFNVACDDKERKTNDSDKQENIKNEKKTTSVDLTKKKNITVDKEPFLDKDTQNETHEDEQDSSNESDDIYQTESKDNEIKK